MRAAFIYSPDVQYAGCSLLGIRLAYINETYTKDAKFAKSGRKHYITSNTQ
jgi:hypothetical protein